MNLKFSWIVFLMWMLFKKIKRKKGHLHVQNFIRMNHLPCRTVKADHLDAFCIFFLSTWTHFLPASCKDCCIMFLLHLLNGFGICIICFEVWNLPQTIFISGSSHIKSFFWWNKKACFDRQQVRSFSSHYTKQFLKLFRSTLVITYHASLLTQAIHYSTELSNKSFFQRQRILIFSPQTIC